MKSTLLTRLLKMLALAASAFLCVRLGIKPTVSMETALIPVLVALTALGLGIASLYQLAQAAYLLANGTAAAESD